jgi:Fe-S-cluster containining protein
MPDTGQAMECRSACGACCIAPSINAPFVGMPQGKAAGVACVHLDERMSCLLFGDARRPLLCAAFTPEHNVCSVSRYWNYKPYRIGGLMSRMMREPDGRTPNE